jgi:vacuolar-type H+-ATPase subunit H
MWLWLLGVAEEIDSMIQRLIVKNARKGPRTDCVFSVEDAQTLIQKALSAREEQLIDEYNKILHDRLQGMSAYPSRALCDGSCLVLSSLLIHTYFCLLLVVLNRAIPCL